MAMFLHPVASMNELSEYTGLKIGVIRYQREKMKDYVRTERIGSNKAGQWQIHFVD